MSQSDKEKRLIELAKQIDAQSDDCMLHWRPDPGDNKLSDDEVAELHRAQRALEFLNDIRQTTRNGVPPRVFPPPDSNNGESCRHSQDTTHGPVAETRAVPKSRDSHPENQTWGRFRIIRQLGQGGFARVFLADDPKLDRQVALKIPKPSVLFDEPSRIRFEREARAASLLSHPAIVPVFDVGTENGVCFIVFGHCPGKSLAEWLSEQSKVPIRTAVAIVTELAEATQHAHDRGIIHRDLKPGNILINESADNMDAIAKSIRITDFGLAKQINTDDHSLTLEGDVIGTPAYMSPEQARGDTDVGAGTDIFSLGTIFYELLTGETPFKKPAHLATLRAIETQAPVSPQGIRPEITNDLQAICLKCLNKEPSARYTSAFELQQDLLAWQHGLPVRARASTRLEELWKWCRRNPAVAAALTFAFLSLATGLSLTAWKWREASHNLQLAAVESTRAQAHLDNLENSIKNLQQVVLDVQVIPKTSPLRARILDRVIGLQELLITREQDSPRARLLAFDGYQCLARAKRSLGDFQGADEAIQRANQQLTRFAQLNEFDLFTREFEIKKIDQLNLEAEILNGHRNYSAVKTVADKALALLSDPDSLIEPVTRSGLAASFLKLKGTAHERLNEFEEAETVYSRCLNEFGDIQEQLTERHWLFNRANCVNSLAILKKRMGKFDEAKQCYAQAIEMIQSLLVNDPGHQHYRALNATATFNLANLYFQTREWQLAGDYYERSYQEFKSLVDDFPEDREFVHQMLSAKSAHATTLGKSGNHVQAAETLQQLLETATNLPDSFSKDELLLRTSINLGRLMFLQLDQIDEAERLFCKTLKQVEHVRERYDNERQFSISHGIVLLNLDELCFRKGQWDDAEQFALAAERIYQSLHESTPNDRKIQNGLAAVFDDLGKICAARGNLEKAEKHYARILALDPDSPQMNYNFARCYARAYTALSSDSVIQPLTDQQFAILFDSAIMHARTAFELGFENVSALKRDNAWKAFVNEKRYQDLLSELSERKFD